MMLAAALVALMIVMLMLLLRASLGPTLYDRIMAINAFGTTTVLALAVLGFFMGRPSFMAIALVYQPSVVKSIFILHTTAIF